jgi:hypothetical protein
MVRLYLKQKKIRSSTECGPTCSILHQRFPERRSTVDGDFQGCLCTHRQARDLLLAENLTAAVLERKLPHEKYCRLPTYLVSLAVFLYTLAFDILASP